MRIAGTNGTLTRTHTEDGVSYELYATEGGGGAVRVVDTDSDNVVAIKRYATFVAATADYTRTLKAVS